jgi:UDP-N-acetylmuramoylalanine--D-glutamate ligase
MSTSSVPLPGRHNQANVLAAAAAAAALGVDEASLADAIPTFQPPPHRLQTVTARNGVRYVDDSIATSPDRACVALEAISGPVLLIAGGRHKNLPWEGFARAVARRARALFLIGEAAEEIDQAVREALRHSRGELEPSSIYRCASLPEAVGAASRLGAPGDVVLLSPACTSYDMFRDFEERGEAFARAVELLDAP